MNVECYGPTCLLRDRSVATWPEVLQLLRVTGAECCVLLVAVPDPPALRALLDRLGNYGRPESSLVLDDVLAWAPVQPVSAHPETSSRQGDGRTSLL